MLAAGPPRVRGSERPGLRRGALRFQGASRALPVAATVRAPTRGLRAPPADRGPHGPQDQHRQNYQIEMPDHATVGTPPERALHPDAPAVPFQV